MSEMQMFRSLEEIAELYRDALLQIITELGIPDENYPAPVANAWEIATKAIRGEQWRPPPMKVVE